MVLQLSANDDEYEDFDLEEEEELTDEQLDILQQLQDDDEYDSFEQLAAPGFTYEDFRDEFDNNDWG